MAEVYYLLIKNGIQKFESVPEKYKADVQALLDRDKQIDTIG